MDKLKTAIRWVAVLPGAFACAWLIGFIFGTVTGFIHSTTLKQLLTMISYTVTGGVFVDAGASIAPSHKTICAVILMLITMVFVAMIQNRILDDYLLVGGACIALLTKLASKKK